MRVSLIFYSNFVVLIGTPALLPGLTLLENNVRVVGNVHVFDLVDIVEVLKHVQTRERLEDK